MSYHIIDISTTGVQLSVKDEQLVCRNPDNSIRKLPMEDIGAVLVNSFSANFHSSFLVSAAEHKIAVFVCNKFKPVSMVLPVQRATDTILTRAQIEAPMKRLRKMWLKTVEAKCQNQYELLQRIAPQEEKTLLDFHITLARADPSKEGNCARLYWSVFSRLLGLENFRRLRDRNNLNGLLNYGYAVLMLRVEQKLLGCGLDPLYGMGHYPRERSMPLAYDIMEPFRPLVDEMIFRWAESRLAIKDEPHPLDVDTSFKQYAQGMMSTRHQEASTTLTLDEILEATIKGFRLALTTGKEALYKPWIRRNSKWVG